MKKTFVIAEAGVNHNGRIDVAYKLIDAAVSAGADAVKFQTFEASNLVLKSAEKAEYQKDLALKKETQFEMLTRLELSKSGHLDLQAYCKDRDIIFLSSAFDLKSIDFLNQIGLRLFKIPSGEITNVPYLRKIGKLKKEVILSTGASELDEIKTAVDVLKKSGTPQTQITVLHCNSQYPTPVRDVNLACLKTLRDELGTRVGYSDHTMGIEVPIAAVALGATVIEKHLTLNQEDNSGPDHKASLMPVEFGEMVRAIRNIDQAMGDGVKTVSESEEPNRLVIRKSIVASRRIMKGAIFNEDNLSVKRPSGGIGAELWDDLIGTVATKDYSEDEWIEIS